MSIFGNISSTESRPDTLRAMAAALAVASFQPGEMKVGWALVSGPKVYEDAGVRVVADCRLYNVRELAAECGEKTDDEAAVIAAGYRRFGTDVLARLRGVFALCLIDREKRMALIATDPYGIKPVYFHADGKQLHFASRPRGILAAPDLPAQEVAPDAVVDFLNLSAIPSPKTIFRDIHRILPGHFLEVAKDRPQAEQKRYYDIDYGKEERSETYYFNNLPRAIETSTRDILAYELAGGSRAGCFLSGGTDSSSVVGMAKKSVGEIEAFSIGFDEPGYNELDFARTAARHFDVKLHEYMVTPEDVLETLDVVAATYDEPFGNSSVVPTFFCARMAREAGVDVLLAGDGGDEIFGGNERYAGDKVFARYQAIPAALRKGLLEPIVNSLPAVHPVVEKGQKYIRRANIPLPDRFYSYNPVMGLGMEAIFAPEFLQQCGTYDPVAWARDLYHGARADEDLDRLLYLDMKFTITDNDLRKVTDMSEAAGIRVAYPLLDKPLVDFAAGMPTDLKVRGDYLRYMFKQSLAGFLPPEIIAKKKHGFGLPIGVWTRSNEKVSTFFRETLLDPNRKSRAFFREGFVEDVYRQHRETGAAYYGDILWHLMVFELWCRKNGSYVRQ